MIKNIFTKTRIKIIIVLVMSFFLVEKLSPQVFIGQTPKINPFFVENLKNSPYLLANAVKEWAQKPVNLVANLTNIFRRPLQNQQQGSINQGGTQNTTQPAGDIFANVRSVTPPPNVIFKTLSKGVQAGEDPQTSQAFIKVEAGTKYRIVGTVIINGKEYPKIEFVNE